MVPSYPGLVHLGPLLHPEANDILVVGLAGGATAGATALYPGVHVHVVELSDAVFGAATWERWDPKSDRFSIYVRGLSDGYKEMPNPNGGKPIVKYKTLRIDFIRRGDERNLNEKEIHLNDPPYEWLTDQFAKASKKDIRFVLEVGASESRGALGGSAPSILEANRKLRDVLKKRGYDVTYAEVANGAHSPESWRERLPGALEAIFSRRRAD